MASIFETYNFLMKEEFGKNVIINCNAVTRLPNTCSVSFSKTAMTGGEILSRCPELMASTGAACHGTGKPSGYTYYCFFFCSTLLVVNFFLILFLHNNNNNIKFVVF
jgi:hypothetical protein